VKRYFEFAQKCPPSYPNTSYARDCHVISSAFLLIRVANRACSFRLSYVTLSSVRCSVVVYKSFHDIGLENCNWISENASCSVQWDHKSRDFCVRVTKGRQKWERETHFFFYLFRKLGIELCHSNFVRLVTHYNEHNAVTHR